MWIRSGRLQACFWIKGIKYVSWGDVSDISKSCVDFHFYCRPAYRRLRTIAYAFICTYAYGVRIHTYRYVQKKLTDAKIQLLQLRDVAGTDITPELCERICQDIKKIAKG